MNKDVKKLAILHTSIHSLFQLMMGIIYGFGIYMLIERGYSSTFAGICFSFVNLLYLIITPVVSNYLDRTEKITVFDVIIVSSILTTILYIINYFINTKSLLLVFAFILGNAIYDSLDSVVNSISSKVGTYGIEIPYTSARAVGSFSYGIACALFGYISSKASYLSVVLGGIIFSFLTFIVGIIINNLFKNIKKNINVKKVEKVDLISYKDFFKNNIHYIILIIFLTGIFIGYTCTDNFLLLVVENVGGTSADMGYILATKAFLEAIAIFMFPIILKKINLELSLAISAIAFIGKQLLIAIAPNILILYVAQLLQMLSFAFVTPGIVAYVNKYLKDREIVRGISMYSISLGIGSIVSSLFGGYISDVFGVSYMNNLALLITTISSIGFIITLNIKQKKTS